jgi:hypothetical protein
MLQSVCLILLLAISAPAAAQQPPEPDAAAAPEQAAVQERNAGQQEDAEHAEDAAGETQETQIEPADSFDPTEQVDEDISVPFPVDI